MGPLVYNDISLDIETTGTDPEHNAIIQIGAVKFDYATGQVGGIFNRCLSMPADRYWDEGTRSWWSTMPEILGSIWERQENPAVVMRDLADWANEGATNPVRLWAKPVSFELPFLASYFRKYGIHNPFHYRSAVDLNSYCRGLAGDPGASPIEKQIPFEGNAHDALDDALHQLKVALMAKEFVNAKA